MIFIVTYSKVSNTDVVILQPDKWDDYGYRTLFEAKYIDKDGNIIELGSIKIAKSEMPKGYTATHLPEVFERLPSEFFSLWQSAESYQKVKNVENVYNLKILQPLNDIAYDHSFFVQAMYQKVFKKSFLRFVSIYTILQQFRRIAHGKAILTAYDFDYIVKQKDDYVEDLKLSFSIRPNSLPPTNVHVIIGSNGTGKTTLIKNMIECICNKESSKGEFIYPTPNTGEFDCFESVMCISFNPFDDYSEVEEYENFRYIGLRKKFDSKDNVEWNVLADIKEKFIDSYKKCMANSTYKKDWINIVSMFCNDTDFLFGMYEFSEFISDEKNLNHEDTTVIESIFENSSAGHKLILSIITRCIDQLAEKTILFIDELENHLHPPLLSAMIRGISNMLIKRNGVAIISTHSPIVLQEVPSSCVWILNREDSYMFGSRPEIETFGTNIGVLTNEIFGYEVKKSGFNSLLRKVVNRCDTYEQVLAEFGSQLGDEAKSIIRILLAQKEDK